MMENRYIKAKKRFLEDKKICKENKKLYKQFFEELEYKLKRQNKLRTLDESCYKTLYAYITRLKNVNEWFKNKPLKNITKKDIKQVYDDLEDEKILNKFGKPYKDTKTYYDKVFKSKLFRMIKKDDLSREIIEVTGNDDSLEYVRFITEQDFRQIENVIIQPKQKLLAWLAFDIGENVSSLLQLRKKDCVKKLDEETNNPEYHIILRKKTLKRSRTARTEITNYDETVKLLDFMLKNLQNDEFLFDYGHKMASKFLKRSTKITGIKSKPNETNVTWKDLRSSMACDLLTKEWTREEINDRLGHKPSSKEIDKYINFLAIDKKKPKRKIYENNLIKLREELYKTKEREKLTNMRLKSNEKNLTILQKQLEEREKRMKKEFYDKLNELTKKNS